MLWVLLRRRSGGHCCALGCPDLPGGRHPLHHIRGAQVLPNSGCYAADCHQTRAAEAQISLQLGALYACAWQAAGGAQGLPSLCRYLLTIARRPSGTPRFPRRPSRRVGNAEFQRLFSWLVGLSYRAVS